MTPRQIGLEASVYALQQAATSLGDPDLTAQVKQLYEDMRDQWFPVLTAGGLMSRASDLGDKFAARTGVNPLDVETSLNSVGGAAALRHDQVVSGDFTANAGALADDVATSAAELAAAAGKAAGAVGGELKTLAIWLLVIIGAALLVYAFVKGK